MPQAPSVPPGLQATVRQAITQRGIASVARQLGVSRQSLASLVAGLPVRRGTILVIESGLRSEPQPTPDTAA